ncbi:Pycsar system effector family protein [uncultured Kriegella sp.]|uniref:Pycsar system effector family protein n=1 Tax=uncultured Kriegella sp. TaxID=1798910 RepID=UPI0030DBA08A|tara:strand:- start:10474 stop:11691 length:1218 start_codon:yes stop_codon:yes gene_type:complete
MDTLFDKTQTYVTQLLSEQLNNNYLFHNLKFTKNTVEHAKKLLDDYSDDAIDKSTVLIAAWFLNSGFYENHQNPSRKACELVKDFLLKNGKEQKSTTKICALIEAAWSNQSPQNEEEKIIKDIRTHYYASEDFEELLGLLLMEQESLNLNPQPIEELRKKYIEILRTDHRFYTDFAKENWQEQKEENVMDLIGSAAKTIKTQKKEELKVKLKNESPERAIQSLYRTQLRNHLKLSDIADTKANILLSVNAIIISLLLANLIPKLGAPTNSYLIYPTVIFVIFSIASMIMSVLATRPKIENKSVVDVDIKKKDTNYLFFGNFHALDPQDFKEKMREIIQSKRTIYDSLSMDLYYLGKVLKTKYQLLRWTYTVFMVGIILSVVAFAIALKYYGMEQEILEAVTPKGK